MRIPGNLLILALAGALAAGVPAAAQEGSAQRSPAKPVEPCPAGKPLGGVITLDMQWRSDGCQGGTRARLRFPMVTNLGSSSPWQARIWTGFSATDVEYELTSGGCTGTVAGQSCRAPEGKRSGKATLGTNSEAGFERGGVGYLHFEPIAPKLVADLLPDEIRTAFATPIECAGAAQGSWKVGLTGVAILPQGERRCANNSGFVFCVPATECAHPAEGAAQACIVQADRYAVLPFSGDASWKSPKVDDPAYSGLLSNDVHWEVCCGCGAPAP